jgi:hypothetical protein
MKPDDLLCSRNARREKTLVGRAQWEINQPSARLPARKPTVFRGKGEEKDNG